MAELEAVFASIEEGNNLDSDEKYWDASRKFCHAQTTLNSMSSNLENENDEESAKIANLYRQQGREYLTKARNTFVKAVEKEIEADASSEEPIYASLLDDETTERAILFKRLFGGKLEVDVPDEKTVKDKETSLMDRMEKLNASIPKGLKTSEERMRDINKGLSRLGVPVHSHSIDNKPKIEQPKSEEEQLSTILAQAKDEARFDASKQNGGGASSVSGGSDNSVSSVESGISADSEMCLDEIDRKIILDSVVDAQGKLAELIALLEVDQDDKAASQKLDLVQARKALKLSRRALQDADKQWEEAVA